jgi:predicted nucleic acid-binding protein
MVAENSVLVDTSVWIEFFRTDNTVGRALEELIRAGRAVATGAIVLELIQGIKSDKKESRTMSLLSDLDYLEMSKDQWVSAGILSRTLKRRGFNLPLSDILLASIAISYDLTLFTLDSHFDSIPEVKRYVP